MPPLPTEQTEGILNEVDPATDTFYLSGALSVTEVEVLDLISEGEIEGLVTGYYKDNGTDVVGTAGNVGWTTYTETIFPDAPDTTDVKYLRSVYWNEVPVVNASNKYNFQRVDLSVTYGHPNGSSDLQPTDEFTISRSISERLRGTTLNSDGDPESINKDYIKYYRIYNKDCKAVIVNIRVSQLGETITQTNKGDRGGLGDVIATAVDYSIYYRALYSAADKTSTEFTLGKVGTLYGKVNYGYIRSERVDFPVTTDSKDLLGWEIKVQRTTLDSTSSVLRNVTFVDSITEVYVSQFTYPNSAIVRSKFDAEFFASIPERAFDVRLLKVKIPNNYDPRKKTYAGTWNGVFNSNKMWTDNPAWCFYDLITNPRYGLGKYINSSLTDKWTLYKIAQYCDTLVSDGYGKLEPRFTCNLILNSRDEAYKVVNDFASVFNAITYYGFGGIYTVQDSPKSPVLHFNNSNVENGDFNYSSSAKKTRHTVAIVRYNDSTNFYKPAIEFVEDVDGIKRYGIKELELTAFGCTSRGQALRFGRWALLSETLETETISFTAGLDGAYLRPGDVFAVYDTNRKTKRHAGRTYIITNPGSSPVITLDRVIDVVAGPTYNLCLVTPSFSYDPVQVTDLTSADFDDIRKSFIQKKTFTSADVGVGAEGFSTITLSSAYNTTDYIVAGHLIWTIEPVDDVTTYTVSSQNVDKNYDYFRAIRIEEKEEHKFQIAGLQYNETKYDLIENGLDFERTPVVITTPPTSPLSLTLSITEKCGNFNEIHYSFTVPDTVGIHSFRVFIKLGSFSGTGVPTTFDEMITLAVGERGGIFIAPTEGTWFFRVYSFSDTAGYSTGYAAGSIAVILEPPIECVQIGSLDFKTEIPFRDGVIWGASRKDGTTAEIDQTFEWQYAIDPDAPIKIDDFKFRVTIRPPSESNTPSSTVLLAEDVNIPEYFFSIEQRIDAGIGRNYDVVVEAIDNDGHTSAGNDIPGSPDLWTNSLGYDIMEVYNPSITGVFLSDEATNLNGYKTQQYITSDGLINIHFASGHIPPDARGGFVYSATGRFERGHIDGTLSPPSFEIKTGEFLAPFGSPAVISSVKNENLLRVKTGYIAIAFYDSYDLSSYRKGNAMESGLWVSYIVPCPSSGFMAQNDGFSFGIYPEPDPVEYPPGKSKIPQNIRNTRDFNNPLMRSIQSDGFNNSGIIFYTYSES